MEQNSSSVMPQFGNLLTVEKAAEALGLKPGTIRKMIREKRIGYVRPSGRSIRIPASVVHEMVQANFHPPIAASK